jgi:hypothetical protein
MPTFGYPSHPSPPGSFALEDDRRQALPATGAAIDFKQTAGDSHHKTLTFHVK